MASSVSSSSGIDTETIVAAYLARFTAQYITPLETKKTECETQASALSTLASKLSSLETALTALKTGSAFDAKTATSSIEETLTVAADSTALDGTYNITVNQLATVHKTGSAQFTSTGTDIVTAEGAGTKTFNITINGTTKSVSVTLAAGDTNATILGNIATQINASGIDGTAIVVNETGTTSRLVISSNDSGTANAISIADTSGTLMQNSQVINGSSALSNELQAAKDALFNIDGLAFTRSSNTVSDAISGVTFVLLKEASSSVVKVETDTEAVVESIQDFIDAYNAVVSYTKAQTSYNTDTQEEGTLLYNSLARTLPRQMAELIYYPVTGLPAAYESIGMIGINLGKDSTLSITDSSKLTNALKTNLQDVENIFNSSGVGIAVVLKNYVDNITDTNGALTQNQNTIQDYIDRYEQKITQFELSYDSYETILRDKYSALDSLIIANQSLISSLSGYSLIPKTT